MLPVQVAKASRPENILSLLRPDIVLHDTPDRTEAVFPADFFAFFVGTAVVGDAYFVDAYAFDPGDLGGNLGLEAEAGFFELYGLYDLPAHQLIACLHV